MSCAGSLPTTSASTRRPLPSWSWTSVSPSITWWLVTTCLDRRGRTPSRSRGRCGPARRWAGCAAAAAVSAPRAGAAAGGASAVGEVALPRSGSWSAASAGALRRRPRPAARPRPAGRRPPPRWSRFRPCWRGRRAGDGGGRRHDGSAWWSLTTATGGAGGATAAVRGPRARRTSATRWSGCPAGSPGPVGRPSRSDAGVRLWAVRTAGASGGVVITAPGGVGCSGSRENQRRDSAAAPRARTRASAATYGVTSRSSVRQPIEDSMSS